MKYHLLKTLPKYYKAIKEGKKKFEVRRNDRDFKVGDILLLALWDKEKSAFVDNEFIDFEVTYILPGGQFGIASDMCVMSLRTPIGNWTDAFDAYESLLSAEGYQTIYK